MAVQSLTAITLATPDMEASLAFYAVLGFRTAWDGEGGTFVVINSGQAWMNLFVAQERDWRGWGRFILYVDDVDATHEALRSAGFQPDMPPSDAPWGERYFHVHDPAGHEVSIAKRIRDRR
jgi:catechol 2,3-dioxygenase-like lactoylglutathione lyase family enzyme